MSGGPLLKVAHIKAPSAPRDVNVVMSRLTDIIEASPLPYQTKVEHTNTGSGVAGSGVGVVIKESAARIAPLSGVQVRKEISQC